MTIPEERVAATGGLSAGAGLVAEVASAVAGAVTVDAAAGVAVIAAGGAFCVTATMCNPVPAARAPAVV